MEALALLRLPTRPLHPPHPPIAHPPHPPIAHPPPITCHSLNYGRCEKVVKKPAGLAS